MKPKNEVKLFLLASPHELPSFQSKALAVVDDSINLKHDINIPNRACCSLWSSTLVFRSPKNGSMLFCLHDFYLKQEQVKPTISISLNKCKEQGATSASLAAGHLLWRRCKHHNLCHGNTGVLSDSLLHPKHKHGHLKVICVSKTKKTIRVSWKVKKDTLEAYVVLH